MTNFEKLSTNTTDDSYDDDYYLGDGEIISYIYYGITGLIGIAFCVGCCYMAYRTCSIAISPTEPIDHL